MKTIRNFLAMAVLTIGMYTVQVFAEETQKSSTQITAKFEVEILDKKLITIQTQIDELNKKIVTSKGKEKIKLFREKQKLEQEKNTILIASKDAELKKEKAETTKKTEKTASMYNELIDTVGSIKETLK